MKLSVEKTTFLLSLLLILSVASYAQNNANIQAIALFNKAQTAYDNASYEESLDFVKQTETFLGSTNSKLLYLKVQNLNLLSKIDAKKSRELQSAIADFFRITNQKTFPPEKYMNVVNIELDLKNQLAKEESDFAKTKGSNDINEYETFFTTYPGSKHEAELKIKYNQLLAQKKIADQRVFDQKWKDENLPLIKKNKTSGIACLTLGSIFLGGGLAMDGIFMKLLLAPPKTVTWHYDADLNANVKNTNTNVNPVLLWSMVGVGVASTIIGVVLIPIGANKLHKASSIKRNGKSKGIDLSYSPSISPITNSYSVNFSMKF